LYAGAVLIAPAPDRAVAFVIIRQSRPAAFCAITAENLHYRTIGHLLGYLINLGFFNRLLSQRRKYCMGSIDYRFRHGFFVHRRLINTVCLLLIHVSIGTLNSHFVMVPM